MAEEVKLLAKEIVESLKGDIKDEVSRCVGDECKRITKQYEDLERKAKETPTEPENKGQWDEISKKLSEISEKLAADKNEPEIEEAEEALKKKKGKKSSDEDVLEELNCPNCGFDKKKKPKYVGHCSGHCSEEGETKFSEFEKESDWEFCPACGSEIEWDEEEED